MTDRPSHPAPPLRTWRPMALWSAVIVLALGLVWPLAVIGKHRYQVHQAREVVRGFQAERWDTDEAVQELGGPERALPLLLECLQTPEDSPGDREHNVLLLGGCGQPAVPALIRVLEDDQEYDDARWAAAAALIDIGPKAAEAVPALVAALSSGGSMVRRNCAEALGAIGPAAKPAISALQKALADQDGDVRREAAEALKKIRGEEPPK